MGQRLLALLTEIQKQHKKLVVKCDRSRWQQQSTSTIPEKCAALATILKADIVVTQRSNLSDVQAGVGSTTEVCLLSDASQSSYETTRLRLFQIDRPLDELNASEVDEVVGRAVKYAPTLRFFDYRMIGSPQRTRKFVAGIQFFITIWENWCVVGQPGSLRVELYTVGNTSLQSGFLSGTDADALLASNIQEPINAGTSANVIRFVKEDSDPKIFHTRGFEARLRAFTLDPGFDAIGPTGAVRRCLLKSELAAERHFAECRKLKDLP